MSIGGQAECPDQGCWSHSGTFLAKSVRQGERNTLNKGDANAGFKAVGWVRFCFTNSVLAAYQPRNNRLLAELLPYAVTFLLPQVKADLIWKISCVLSFNFFFGCNGYH